MLIEQPPLILRMLYPRAFWRMDKHVKAVYLTFDDGPIPEITPWVLDLLDKYNIKATFFLVGDNVRKHPEEFKMIVDRGHRLGDTVKPRLIEAEADLDRVLVIDEAKRELTLSDERIEKAITQNGARLIILDPIQAYMGEKTDMNRANEVRPMLDRKSTRLNSSHRT